MGGNILCPWVDRPDYLLHQKNCGLYSSLIDYQKHLGDPIYHKRDIADSLLLNDLTVDDVGTPRDLHRLFLVQFLQDPNRSGSYTIGDAAYTAATLFLIEGFGKLLECSNGDESEDSDVEHSLSKRLILEGGRWVFKSESDSLRSFLEVCFLLLGYIDFFLPLCGNSGQPSIFSGHLMRYCHQHRRLPQRVKTLFPTRSARVEKSINDYLCRS